jgi:hypothetical protein
MGKKVKLFVIYIAAYTPTPTHTHTQDITMPITIAGGAVSSKGNNSMIAERRVGISLPA